MAIALTDFTAMCGFRPLGAIVAHLELYPELASFVDAAAVEDLKRAYERTKGLVGFDQSTNKALKGLFSSFMSSFDASGREPLAAMISRLAAVPEPERTSLDSLLLSFAEQFPGDCGVFSPLLLQVHELSPGQSLFVPANTPHAYVSGEIVECMARSDNVIRCGLTPKFKDVEVLCDSLTYEVVGAGAGGEGEETGEGRLYRPPVADFEVRVAEVEEGGSRTFAAVDSAAVLLVLEGGCEVEAGGEREELGFGQALFISANTRVEIKGGCKVVRALRNLGEL